MYNFSRPFKDIATLEELFKAQVKEAYYLIDNKIGLRIVFAPQADTVSFNEQTPEIINLVSRLQVISLINFNPHIDSMRDLSDSAHCADPFHRDYSKETPISILSKPVGKHRKAPTYYAMPDQVIEAMQHLNTSDWEKVHQRAVRHFSSGDHFDLDSGSNITQVSRALLQKGRPKSVKEVFDAIPDGLKYEQDWNTDSPITVLHLNAQDSIVHARPFIDDNDHQILSYASLQ